MLELRDLIRMNQLVRGEIDFAGFDAWLSGVEAATRGEILRALNAYAHEAGVNDETIAAAIVAAGMSPDESFVQQIRELCVDRAWAAIRIEERLDRLPPQRDPRVERFFVALFGTAEGRVFARETPECCNHWWHRDLLDPRVVAAILRDPDYYRTSRRDDAAIQSDG